MRENEVLTGGEEGVASPGEGKEVWRGTGGREEEEDEEEEEDGMRRRRSMFLGRAEGPRERGKGTSWAHSGQRSASAASVPAPEAARGGGGSAARHASHTEWPHARTRGTTAPAPPPKEEEAPPPPPPPSPPREKLLPRRRPPQPRELARFTLAVSADRACSAVARLAAIPRSGSGSGPVRDCPENMADSPSPAPPSSGFGSGPVHDCLENMADSIDRLRDNAAELARTGCFGSPVVALTDETTCLDGVAQAGGGKAKLDPAARAAPRGARRRPGHQQRPRPPQPRRPATVIIKTMHASTPASLRFSF
ncbi:hypothetical protein ACMD2_25554 [Ananas comosus]|uniref:Pectinesterase inhibitor domain-containing protein n=1 Tax=Ananas comosus TaxID=4615 RepID=A0A199UYT5_ANACO|nr:hypothetical protein ACMD2_25554 [Ananas comosus]